MAVTKDGLLLCTAAQDKALKVFDVVNFGQYFFGFAGYLLLLSFCFTDMINMLRLGYTPAYCVWLYAGGAATAAVAW